MRFWSNAFSVKCGCQYVRIRFFKVKRTSMRCNMVECASIGLYAVGWDKMRLDEIKCGQMDWSAVECDTMRSNGIEYNLIEFCILLLYLIMMIR